MGINQIIEQEYKGRPDSVAMLEKALAQAEGR